MLILNNAIKSNPSILNQLEDAPKCDQTEQNLMKNNESLESCSIYTHSSNSISNLNSISNSNSFFTPPKNIIYNPFRRGSVLLQAAGERKANDYSRYTNSLDEDVEEKKSLRGILRKRKLSFSFTPLSAELKLKKKRVLFADPIVSSEHQVEPSSWLRTKRLRRMMAIRSSSLDETELNHELNENINDDVGVAVDGDDVGVAVDGDNVGVAIDGDDDGVESRQTQDNDLVEDSNNNKS